MKDNTKGSSSKGQEGKIIKTDESEVRSHVDEVVRSTAEETLNEMLDAEAGRYERSPLGSASLRHIAGTKWGTRRYMRMERLFEQERSVG